MSLTIIFVFPSFFRSFEMWCPHIRIRRKKNASEGKFHTDITAVSYITIHTIIYYMYSDAESVLSCYCVCACDIFSLSPDIQFLSSSTAFVFSHFSRLFLLRHLSSFLAGLLSITFLLSLCPFVFFVLFFNQITTNYSNRPIHYGYTQTHCNIQSNIPSVCRIT